MWNFDRMFNDLLFHPEPELLPWRDTHELPPFYLNRGARPGSPRSLLTDKGYSADPFLCGHVQGPARIFPYEVPGVIFGKNKRKAAHGEK
jgi:hypothetical protein